MEFDLPKENSSIIKVIGVGGGGSNAVNHMYLQGIKGVDFMVCNTDHQALNNSPVPIKIQLGATLTQGLGAGALPEVGKNSAIESIDDIKDLFGNSTKMVFITAGMGGGTGTGAAPIIASIAREMGILTVGIVTIPFSFEGKKRKLQAEEGLDELRNNVDTLLIINNDKLREIYGNLSLKNAFAEADNVLTTAAKGIAEVITVHGHINVDFNDVKTVMTNGGTAIMGYAMADGDGRALKAVENALASPLLNDNNIYGANQVLVYITSGTSKEVTMDEVGEINDYIQEEAGSSANIIFGVSYDDSLGDQIRSIVIATGFSAGKNFGIDTVKTEKKVYNLDDSKPKAIENEIIPDASKEEENKDLVAEQPVEESEPQMYIKTLDEVKAPVTPAQDAKETSSQQSEQKIIHFLGEEKPSNENTDAWPEKYVDGLTVDEQLIKTKERINKLKEMNFKLKRPDNINLENEPAYKRRNIQLDNVPHSSESQVSRFTLTETEDKKTEIRPNNSFLHDNVD
jgi:cell division protein FtsZ